MFAEKKGSFGQISIFADRASLEKGLKHRPV